MQEEMMQTARRKASVPGIKLATLLPINSSPALWHHSKLENTTQAVLNCLPGYLDEDILFFVGEKALLPKAILTLCDFFFIVFQEK